MPRDGSQTKTTIMDAAELLILEQGFAGTPIEDIIQAADVTKGAFFHHFETKQTLAHALIDRFIERDQAHLREKMERVERLHKDPLQQLLLFVAMFREEAQSLLEPTPGCLIGSYVYEAGLFDDEILVAMKDDMILWREVLLSKLKEIANVYPPRLEVNMSSVADMMTVIFEGAFVVARTVKEPALIADQLEQYRSYLELLFSSPD